MYVFKFKQRIIWLAFIFLLLTSCDGNNDDLSNFEDESPYFVKENLVQKIVGNVDFKQLKSKSAFQSTKKKILDLTPVEDENCKTIFYIVNFEDGGFVIS